MYDKRSRTCHAIVGVVLLAACGGSAKDSPAAADTEKSDAKPAIAITNTGAGAGAVTSASSSDHATVKAGVANGGGAGSAATSGTPSAMATAISAGTSDGGSSGLAGSSAAAAGAAGSTLPTQSNPSNNSSPTSAVMSGPTPKLPAITGDCPKFASGDWSFSGMSGVMDVGAKSEGKGALVFFWAGTDQPASNYTQIGENNIKRVTSEGGVIVSIQGSAQHALDTDCSITGYYSHNFVPIGQIAACAVRDFGIDPRRIYSTGCSAGGVTSGCMATRCSSYIAAVATNSGGLSSVEKLERIS